MTIQTKISLFSTLITAILLGAFAALVYEDVRNAEIAKLDDRLELQGEEVRAEFEEEQAKAPAEVMTIYLSEKPIGLGETPMELLGTNGEIFYRDTLLRFASSSPPSGVWQGGAVRGELPLQSGAYRSLWTPVFRNGRVICVLHIVSPMSAVESSLRPLRLLFFIVIPLALLLTALSAMSITRIAFMPVRKMIETSQEISAQNLETRLILPPTHDEVRFLGEALNGMMDRIEAAFKSQKKFIADASHELRTPLTVIGNELEFAGKRTTDPAILESIHASMSELNTLASTAEKLLLLARLDASPESLSMKKVRLDELMMECVQRVRSLALRKNILLQPDIDEAVEIPGDAGRLTSALVNLIENAIKYSGENTSVGVALRTNGAPDGRVRILVSDRGCGIRREDLPHIFARFYRAENVRGDIAGSGLGLAIAERVVTLHGGTISVESEVGKGSTFTVDLPRAQLDNPAD
ncbi:MAG TPA: HAMP domain-containing sensor histidine kinase [Bacteroidota bacterium]|nr:HAMP domain-containing sensor histidine kinase [Bacteroidota bacterium]